MTSSACHTTQSEAITQSSRLVSAAVVCEKPTGYSLVNYQTRKWLPACCRDRRRCALAARLYGWRLSKWFSRIRNLKSFTVLTTPPDHGSCSADDLRREAKVNRRVNERLRRQFQK